VSIWEGELNEGGGIKEATKKGRRVGYQGGKERTFGANETPDAAWGGKRS